MRRSTMHGKIALRRLPILDDCEDLLDRSTSFQVIREGELQFRRKIKRFNTSGKNNQAAPSETIVGYALEWVEEDDDYWLGD